MSFKIIKIAGLPIVIGCFVAIFHARWQLESANDMILANVEALTFENSGGGDSFADCPRDKYNRNEKETWIPVTVSYEAGFGFYVTIKGKKVKIGAEANVGGTVFYPDCVSSKDNCCEKKHIDKPFRYV